MPGIIMFDACSSMSLHAPEPYKHDLLIINKLTALIHFEKRIYVLDIWVRGQGYSAKG